MAKGDPPMTATCVCGCAGIWHKPDCRIRGCDCTEFKHAVARLSDGTWVDQKKPHGDVTG